jgi:glucosyl-3-phosphoglycerate synthase
MAFGILQTFLPRLEEHQIVTGLPEIRTIMRQFQTTGQEHEQVEYEITQDERPPMCEIEAYLEKQGHNR